MAAPDGGVAFTGQFGDTAGIVETDTDGYVTSAIAGDAYSLYGD